MTVAETLKSAFVRPATEPEVQAQAFEAAALPHLNDLFRTATRILGNPTEAEDIVQETYLLAWKSFHRFEPGTDCRAWLFTIMFNAVRHYRRKWLDRKVTAETDQMLDLAYTPPVPEQLSDVDILSADVEEFSYKEIAGILNVPIGTIMSRLNRGRALLRAALADLARSYGIHELRKTQCKQA